MIDSPEKKVIEPEYLSGGEMGRLIRQFDWSKTSLGPREKWSENLKNVVSMMLVNRFPMLLWWGKDYIHIYNDAYIPVLGLKHPNPGLGNPGYVVWSEIWDVLAPLVDTPFNGGPPTWMDDILLKVNRNNRIEETHFTVAYSPVPDATVTSGIGGVLATVNEITKEIIGGRQMEMLRKLGKAIATTLSEQEVYAQTMSVFKENTFDIPFSIIHRVDEKGELMLAATVGIQTNHPVIATIHAGSNSISVSEFDTEFKDLPMGGWDIPPTSYIRLPIRASKGKSVVAIITIALNPFRTFDDSYSNFIDLISDQVTFGVSTAIAFKEEQKRAEALAEIDKAKTLFFGNVSHEFRTPLTLILGPVNDLLTRDTSSIVMAERETMLLMQRNALRLQKLVNTLLDFSRIEAGKYKASFRAVDFSRFTLDLASNFRSLLTNAGLKFECNCPSLSEPVYLDPEMWEKIVLNLISNAFKFTFEGTISIETSQKDDHVEMLVSDTGIGISTENLIHLFERFHRVENARSRTHEGSGIGLALVNELVKLHGGTIDVDSTEGKGTTFRISIPLGYKHLPADQIRVEKEGQVSTAIRPEAFLEEAMRWTSHEESQPVYKAPDVVPKVQKAKPQVLLADDNADMQMYIKSILSQYCDIHLASNGRQAIEIAKRIIPDLVLTDIMMPEVDGFGVLKAMRTDESLKIVPVILLSARAGEEAKVEGFDLGADDYLTKPFGRNELIARVNSNLQLSKVRKEVQQAIRYSEAKFRALVTATSDVIYRMSPDWKIMWQLDGRSFLRDTGEPLTDWQEKYIHPKDRARVEEAIKVAVQNKTNFQLEHQVIRADGSLGWTLSRAIPILNDNGDIVEWFGAASDISARKLYQAELETRVEDRTRELQISNDDLQQFAHVASHDLKEPLRKIKTFTLRLKEENQIPEERGMSYVEKVLSSADRMSTMIDGVLTYSSLNAGGFTVEDIDLNSIIQNIEVDLELVIQQKQAKIEYHQLPVIKGGRVLIHQLFYNLINNSLKFSSPQRHPVIKISASSAQHDGKNIHVITVTDNGIGFDQNKSNLIFETFTRLHSKDQYDGTGLGLALCKKIVERHHGTIHATAKKNEGASFIIELPYKFMP